MMEGSAAAQGHLGRLEKQDLRISKENVKSCTWDGKIPVQAGDKWLESSFCRKEACSPHSQVNMSKQGVLVTMRSTAY